MSDAGFAVQRLLMNAAPVVTVERRALLGERKSLVNQVHAAFLVHTECDAVAVHIEAFLLV